MNSMFKFQKKIMNEQRYLLIGIIILFLSFCCLLFLFITPSIILKGNKIINIEVNSKYNDPGVDAHYLLADNLDIKTINNVDTSKIGIYEVKYIVNHQNKEYEKIRKVIVKDTTPPVLKLNGEVEMNVCAITDYIELGASAHDNYDGDITSSIKISRKNDEVIYNVKDSSGNESKISRKIVVKDITKPVITLNGDNVIYIEEGKTYHELGASAYDNCSGDITDKIKVELDIDTSKIGDYKVPYKVVDKSNNETIVYRNIKVIPKNEKVIYLTFDDGPSMSITPTLLDILKEENIKATFFVINHSDNLNYLIKRAYDDGHTIGLHSYTHNYKLIYSSVDAYFNDLTAIQNKVESIISKKINLIRFPGGSSNTISRFNPGIMSILTSEVKNRGFVYFDWNVSSGDAGGARNSIDVYENVISNLNLKTNIVLMHDFESNYKTLDAVRNIIRYGKNNGYRFDKISDTTIPNHHVVNN